MAQFPKSNRPKLIVIAGPNGSGKSTITASFQAEGRIIENYINPDEIALSLEDTNIAIRAYRAAAIAEEQRQVFINQQQSFAFETVMSHPSKLGIMQQAIRAGYQVELIFIATSNLEVNIDRVKQRVAEGGHDVPINKIRERYKRTIELLPAAAEIVNITYLFDNTKFPQQEAEVENASVTYRSDNMPLWVQTTIQKLEERARERIAVTKTALQNKLTLNSANIHGSIYTGVVSEARQNYIVQQTENGLILHDRSIVKESFALGQDIRIAYRDGNVAASIQPNQENRQWAEGIVPIVNKILQSAKQLNKIETSSRGIEIIKGNNYQLQVNRNTETLTISSKENNRLIASYNLSDLTVIAANPTEIDKQSSHIDITQKLGFEL